MNPWPERLLILAGALVLWPFVYLFAAFALLPPGAAFPGSTSNLAVCGERQALVARTLATFERDTSTRVAALDFDSWSTLVLRHYLPAPVGCPSRGAEGYRDFVLVPRRDWGPPEGRCVGCVRHGFAVPPRGCLPSASALEQFRALGVVDAALLARLSTLPADSPDHGRLVAALSDWRRVAVGLLALVLALAAVDHLRHQGR